MSPESARFRIDIAEAEALIRGRVPRWPAVRVAIDQAAGEVLREPIAAERDQPPFDRVTMDGIAIRFPAWAAGRRRFIVRGVQAAGAPPIELTSDGDCTEIMTGAALPSGADTIIPIERLRRDGAEVEVEADYRATAGQFVHRRGSDHPAGTTVLQPGTWLTPPAMAILTISGSASVSITRRPPIAIVSTGDELVDVGEPILPAQIRSSNEHALAAALASRGYRGVSRHRLRDDLALLRARLADLYRQHDCLILSGGVSMGHFDFVPQVLTELGVSVVFHKVLQRPGMPIWFGVGTDGKPVFALPGNPVSSLVCLIRYVLPGLEHGLGATPAAAEYVRLSREVAFAPDLAWLLPVIRQSTADGLVVATPMPTNTSGDFVSLGGTDGFVELPRGRDVYPAGFVARFFRW